MMKKLLSVMLSVMLLLTAAACAVADEPVRIWALKGPTGVGLVKMMNDNDGSYAFTLAGAPDEVVGAIASGNADIAAVPINLAATLYNKTGGNVQLVALNTLGVLHILSTDPEIDTLEELRGKTIYATGQGSTPEYVLSYILEAAGIADEVKVEYKAEHAELATLAASGKVDLVMLPEPNVTSVLTQNPAMGMVMDVTALFEQAAAAKGEDTRLAMGCVIVRKDWAAANPEKLAQVMAQYADSVAFVNENVDEASQMVEAQGIIPKAAVAKKAIPNCHIVFVSGEEMKTAIAPFYQLLFDANPKSVGGKLPADDFYYIP
ncbi:MAG: ABC transporter substrate-binding protein [Clostridia bacterium]|nr:ABC transporter substrate-binding protein [Clostridia bacterium]